VENLPESGEDAADQEQACKACRHFINANLNLTIYLCVSLRTMNIAPNGGALSGGATRAAARRTV
jgi:hypothetical protein